MPIAQLSAAKISYLDSPASSDRGNLPILLVHGFSSSIKDNWADTGWINFLNDNGLHVIALDNRGHGNSEKFYNDTDYSIATMAKDVVELLDYLKIEKANLLGYSMGARISAMIAMLHPQHTARVILGGNGYGMIEGSGDWTIVRDGLLAPSMDDVTDLRARAFRRFAERTNSDRRALAACIMGNRQLFSEKEFNTIVNQVLVAIGTEDEIAGSGEKLAALIPNGQFFPIKNRDHMRASTDKSFMAEVLRFLSQS